MPEPKQYLPTEISASGTIARRVLRAMGTSVNAPDTSSNAAEALAFADAVADIYSDLLIATNQAFADTASVLMSELESSYGLTVRTDLPIRDRQVRLLAKIRAARAGTPQSILIMIAPYLATAVIYENTSAAVAATNPAGVFIFAVLVTVATFNDPNALAALRALIEQMKPTHTKGSITTRIGFRCDDPDSLLDRDVLL